MQNYWDVDAISDRFDTHKPLQQIHPDAAVNIFVGWPVFLEQIRYQCGYLGKKKCSVLDFGCGAGDFCENLHRLGHKVIGMDSSKPSLDIAAKNTSKEIEYCLKSHVDSDECSMYNNKMDVVTSIHGLDWVENVEEVIVQLAKMLVDNGLLIFSVFPKKHVIDSLRIKDLFEDFDSAENPTKGVCNFGGIKIPVYVRDPSYYDSLFSKLNFDKVLEFYPPYPKVFFDKYKWTGSREPEMVILGYRKKKKS